MIQTIADTDLRLTSDEWPFARERKSDIAAHWAEAVSKKPALFDGKVLGARDPRVENGVLLADMVLARFSEFLAWRDWGYPDSRYFNLFGSAVIAGNDGGIIYGVMGAHTSNAGAIYPCGGSLEPGDVDAEGRADIWASMARELHEETGLNAADAKTGESFLSSAGQLISVTRVFVFDCPTQALADEITENLETQLDRELESVAILRSERDLDPDRMPNYAMQTAQHLLSARK